MAIIVTCACGKSLRARDDAAGKRVRCNACGNPVPVPSIQTTVESAKPEIRSAPAAPPIQTARERPEPYLDLKRRGGEGKKSIVSDGGFTRFQWVTLRAGGLVLLLTILMIALVMRMTQGVGIVPPLASGPNAQSTELGTPLPSGPSRLFKEVKKLEHPGRVNTLAFSPDGRYILGGCGELKIVDRKKKKALPRIGVISDPESRVPDLDFDLIEMNSAALLWDAKSGEELRRLEGHKSHVVCVAFSPDGKRAVTGEFGGTIILWDTTNWAEIGRFVGKDREESLGKFTSLQSLAFSPDGRLVALGGNIAFTLYGSDSSRSRILLWNVDTGKEVTRSGKPYFNDVTYSDRKDHEYVHTIGYTPDGSYLIVGMHEAVKYFRADGIGKEFRTDSKVLDRSPASENRTSPNQPFLYNNVDHAVNPHGACVESAVSPDGRRIFSSGFSKVDERILWGFDTSNPDSPAITILDRQAYQYEGVSQPSFSSDGRYVICHDGTQVTVIEVIRDRLVLTERFYVGSPPDNMVNYATFSHDGQFVGTANGRSIRLWQRR